tara:strand:+ start:139 stop:705 length:567 start_codon:yes stop_codon:yes gene_type:complete
MQDFQSRQLAVATIRARVATVGGTWLSDNECVQIAIACRCREASHVLGVLFNRYVTLILSNHILSLSITGPEWRTLFGHEVLHTRTAGVSDVVRTDFFRYETNKLVAALRSTVAESVQKTVWQRPLSRVAVYVAMNFANYEEAVETTIGGIVRSDLRRLADFCSELEDRGVEVMELSAMISALSMAAC